VATGVPQQSPARTEAVTAARTPHASKAIRDRCHIIELLHKLRVTSILADTTLPWAESSLGLELLQNMSNLGNLVKRKSMGSSEKRQVVVCFYSLG
jgi:hypothetical protein